MCWTHSSSSTLGALANVTYEKQCFKHDIHSSHIASQHWLKCIFQMPFSLRWRFFFGAEYIDTSSRAITSTVQLNVKLTHSLPSGYMVETRSECVYSMLPTSTSLSQWRMKIYRLHLMNTKMWVYCCKLFIRVLLKPSSLVVTDIIEERSGGWKSYGTIVNYKHIV
jgi:hypothetical protein